MTAVPGVVEEALVRRGLLRLMTERNLTCAQAGNILGVHTSQVSRILGGTRGPYSAARVAAAFGITVPGLLESCAQCHYRPPRGYTCNLCGSSTSILIELHMTSPELERARSAIATTRSS